MVDNPSDVVLRGRYLREAQILGRSTKDIDAPQIEVVHVTSIILGVMGCSVQSQAPETARALWGLPATRVRCKNIDPDGRTVFHPSVPFKTTVTFGQAVANLIDQAASLDPNKRALFASNGFENLTLWRERRLSASIDYGDRSEFYGNTPDTSYGHRKPVISNFVTLPRLGVSELAELVEQSRAEAAKRGIKIPVEEACKAVGQSISDLQGLPNGVTAENETAATPGREAAALSDQPAQTELDRGSQSHPTSERDKSQLLSKSRHGRSPLSSRSDSHEGYGARGAIRAAY